MNKYIVKERLVCGTPRMGGISNVGLSWGYWTQLSRHDTLTAAEDKAKNVLAVAERQNKLKQIAIFYRGKRVAIYIPGRPAVNNNSETERGEK
jgi:hypothetical protein